MKGAGNAASVNERTESMVTGTVTVNMKFAGVETPAGKAVTVRRGVANELAVNEPAAKYAVAKARHGRR